MSNEIFYNEKGAVLVTGIMFLAVLSLIGTTAYLSTSNELKTSRNFRLSKMAFYDAEAGAEFALAKIEGYLEADTGLTLPTTTGGTTSLPDVAPTGFSFTLSPITSVSDDDSWSLTSTGDTLGSSSQIGLLFYRVTEPAFNHAAWGNGGVIMMNNSSVFSYDSSSSDPCVNNPSPSNTCYVSTGQADIGSNTTVNLSGVPYVDGEIYLGNDGAGNQATCTGCSAGQGVVVPRVDPDPLGINTSCSAGSNCYNPVSYSSTNNNAAIGGITSINLGTGATMTLCPKAGGGETNYYFTSITLGQSAVLKVDTLGTSGSCGGVAGKINIFLNNTTTVKPLSMGNGADIQVTSQKPVDFSLYSNATSSQILEMKNSSAFYGSIYAPNANVDLKNEMVLYGSLRASTITNFNSSKIYYDTALRNTDGTGGPSVLTDNIAVSSWRYIRN